MHGASRHTKSSLRILEFAHQRGLNGLETSNGNAMEALVRATNGMRKGPESNSHRRFRRAVCQPGSRLL